MRANNKPSAFSSLQYCRKELNEHSENNKFGRLVFHVIRLVSRVPLPSRA